MTEQMELFKDNQTVSEAKTHLRENWIKGVTCPCCDQFVKLYRIKINAIHVQFLINLYRLGAGYHHVSDILNHGYGSGEHAKLKHWGMVEQKPKDPKQKNKRTSGLWKITELGEQFVTNKKEIRKYIKIYNNKLHSYDGPFINVVDALGIDFNYQELMRGI